MPYTFNINILTRKVTFKKSITDEEFNSQTVSLLQIGQLSYECQSNTNLSLRKYNFMQYMTNFKTTVDKVRPLHTYNYNIKIFF